MKFPSAQLKQPLESAIKSLTLTIFIFTFERIFRHQKNISAVDIEKFISFCLLLLHTTTIATDDDAMAMANFPQQ